MIGIHKIRGITVSNDGVNKKLIEIISTIFLFFIFLIKLFGLIKVFNQSLINFQYCFN